jgi:outer membrane autotransporter protein
MQGLLGDINGRLFNLRAGGGEEPTDGGIASSLDDGVIVGQGDGPESPIAKKQLRSRQWEIFNTVNYANISLSSIRNQAGVNSQTWAPGVGIERHFSRHLTLGFAASLMETHQSYSGGLGKLDIEGIALSAYASYVRSAFWSDVLYSFGTFDLNSMRTPGGFPVANGNTSANTNALQFNTGWNFRSRDGRFVTGPFIGVDYLNVQVNGYSETGGGLAALSYNTRSMDSLVTRVGWTVSQRIETDFAIITPQLRLSYERQNISNNNATSVNLINQPFTATTTSQHPGQDYMVAGTGVNFQFSPVFNMLLTYQGQFLRNNLQAHYASVRFGYKF